MNGRAYDYNLGRFLSVDPFIQAPGNSQSMNPYSYIMNNPLAGTDPSGYLWFGASGLDLGLFDDNRPKNPHKPGSFKASNIDNGHMEKLERRMDQLEGMLELAIAQSKKPTVLVTKTVVKAKKVSGSTGKITVSFGNEEQESSESNNDINHPFMELGLSGGIAAGEHLTPEEAEVAALNLYNPISITSDQEYGGAVFKLGDHYYTTIPSVGLKGTGSVDFTFDPEKIFASMNLTNKQIKELRLEKGEPKLVRWFHTHGAGTERDRSYFSKDDYNASKIVPISMSNEKGEYNVCDSSCRKIRGKNMYKGRNINGVTISTELE